jgi:DNA (cytosine-5)-methyltransferase 1
MAIQQSTHGLRELALFAGAGGGILGGHLLGWRTVCAVEWDAYAASVLVARQNDGCLPPFPIWDDVQTFDGRSWRGRIDVVSGGFPCQDISAAGRGAGIEGERSGMWAHMARIIGEVRPRFAFVENSPMLTSRGLGRVLGDLAAMGYDARWGVLGAIDAGAPHKRERIWIVANRAEHGRREGRAGRSDPGNTRKREQPLQAVADAGHMRGRDGAEPSEAQSAATARYGKVGNAMRPRLEGSDAITEPCGNALEPQKVAPTYAPTVGYDLPHATGERQSGPWQSWFRCDPAENREGETNYAFAERVGHIWGIESPVGRVAHGVAARVDRLRCLGNGQVPAVAALAWRTLTS